MKKSLILVVAVAMLLVATSAFATISGSKHDLTGVAILTNPISSCQYCHTPHHASTVDTTLPLWNRNLPTASSFTVYGATTSNATGVTLSGTTVHAPGTHSLTCLSCHDGVTEYGDLIMGGETGFGPMTGTNVIGEDLRTTHPVGVKYDTTLTGLGQAGLGAVPTTTRLYATGGENRVECSSCHDPHSNDRTAGGDTSPFLRMLKSTMCSKCHSQK